jgi:hypothetical protein
MGGGVEGTGLAAAMGVVLLAGEATAELDDRSVGDVLVLPMLDPLVVSDGVLPDVSAGFSGLQPWISMTTKPVTLTASAQPTAIFKRDRRRLCCSSSEPFGTNGFGLFISLAQRRPNFEEMF